MNSFIVNNDSLFLSAESLLEVYRNQSMWNRGHTALIMNSLNKLVPGQILRLTGDNFIINGMINDMNEDDDWSFTLNYPKVIQKMDGELIKLFTKRVSLRNELVDLNLRIAELMEERDKVQDLFNKSEGLMRKYGNGIGKEVKI